MKPVKSFHVFGEPVDVLVNGSMTGGSSALVLLTNNPDSGPPPHMHQKEDEIFLALEGDFELLANGVWQPMHPGVPVFAPRGHVHTYRNIGYTVGKVCVFVSPAGFEDYLEAISPYSPETDMQKVLEISALYGISFMESRG